MLSSYFKNFRYTEDFKKSGKVYIKDTSAKTATAVTQTTTTEPVVSSTTTNAKSDVAKPDNKQLPYNINQYNVATFKNTAKNTVTEALGLNGNNEIINVAQLVDFDALVTQTKNRIKRKDNNPVKEEGGNVIKIDLDHKLPHIKSNPNQSKIAYSIKIDETAKNANQTVLINPLPAELNQNQMMYATSQMNPVWAVVNTPPTTQIVQQTNAMQHSTVNNSYQQQQQPPHLNGAQSEFVVKQIVPTPQKEHVVVVKSHICEICNKAFKRREHLYQHMKMHRGFRAFSCECCNKSFLRKEHLLRHMTSHSGQKNFTCNICEKSFSRNDNLLKHKRTHEKQNSFTCEVCHKQFVMKHYYMAHKLTHETEKCGLNSTWGLLKV